MPTDSEDAFADDPEEERAFLDEMRAIQRLPPHQQREALRELMESREPLGATASTPQELLALYDQHQRDFRDGLELPGARFDATTLRGLRLRRANLRGAVFARADVPGADFSESDLSDANLVRADFTRSHFIRARMTGATLYRADLSGAELVEADLRYAYLFKTNLHEADLRGADLAHATLTGANFQGAILDGTNFSRARFSGASFSGVDLSTARGLEEIEHLGPSTVGIDTLYLSAGRIPDEFLRGCGVPEPLIVYRASLAAQPIDYYSCFISYSSKDDDFARRLYGRLRDGALRVWFAPEDMKGGRKVHEQIDAAIRIHDKLLLVLSPSSMASTWVEREIRRAIQRERKEHRRILFPIRLCEFEALQAWECVDSDTGQDLAQEVRSYFIPDFSEWKLHDVFEHAATRLLTDLRKADR
jgi:hypothetical protein